MEPLPHYRPSGEFSRKEAPKAVLQGLGQCVLVAAVYAVATVYNPLNSTRIAIGNLHIGVIASFVFYLLCWAALAVIVGRTITAAKIRSPRLGMGIGATFALVILYLQWVMIFGLFESPTFLPQDIFFKLMLVVDTESWHVLPPLEDTRANWVMWGIEAVTMIAGGTNVGRRGADLVFCEDCEQWTVPNPGFHLTLIFNPDEMRGIITAGEFDEIEAAIPDDDEQPSFDYRFSYRSCGHCEATFALDLEVLNMRVDAAGKRRLVGTPVFKRLMLSKDQLTLLKDLLKDLSDESSREEDESELAAC